VDEPVTALRMRTEAVAALLELGAGAARGRGRVGTAAYPEARLGRPDDAAAARSRDLVDAVTWQARLYGAGPDAALRRTAPA
jgi:hypothetical protein